MSSSYIILRRLTGSELGWFAEARAKGKAKGRQRGINFNAAEMSQIFPLEILQRGNIPVVSRRLSDGQEQKRPIRLQEKNWRLVGDKVSGRGLGVLAEGDFFWAEIVVGYTPPFNLTWDVISAATSQDLHSRLDREFSIFLKGGMASWPSNDEIAEYLASLVGLHAMVSQPAKKSGNRPKPTPRPTAGTEGLPDPSKPGRVSELSSTLSDSGPPKPKRRRIEDKLRRPHILTEIVKVGMALSAKAQADFMDVLDDLSSAIRSLLSESALIRKVEINHGKTWEEFRGKRIGFVDGGIANVAEMGSAPLAIRVGSYVVTPGDSGPNREEFGFELQLVDDLYEATPGGEGVYEDVFEDVSKLRDVARISAEVGGVLALTLRDTPPEVVFLHGPLVNPVSPYGLEGFPNFTNATIAKLLPKDLKRRSGRDANFIAVQLEQLNRLRSGASTVAGVVERSSMGSPVMRLLIERLHQDEKIDAKVRREFVDKLQGYRITDSVIFECVLDEGEYLEPVEIDKQAPENKIPAAWYSEIRSYPKPLTTYAKAHTETMPVRVEAFKGGPVPHKQMMALVIHMSRLLPRYSFPVGLDIVDKHAKIPEWMSRQMNAMLAAQLMRKAMDVGNPAAVRVVRRILSANTRDWLFRPDFRKGWLS
jgi:hypothetical protein